ncbi:MAG: organic hydroperoxide resistance protein [Prevotellaceae bacterium]|jgi:Ohr subfamily peroxiredoxin|nr:organic hydroperoxide resistance protein [Prevotellaceae bacterium]
MKATYTAVATSIGGREGHVKSVSGIIDMDLRTPQEMGGKGEKGSNPEELFAAGYSACFNGALNLAARMKRVEAGETKVTVSVSFGKSERNEDGFEIEAKIEAEIPGVSQDIADMLVKRAHELYPYSRATRGNIDVELIAKVI